MIRATIGEGENQLEPIVLENVAILAGSTLDGLPFPWCEILPE